MDFSELIEFSGKCEFSPNGKLLASTEKTRVYVRDAESLEVLTMFTCLDSISVLKWSPDSKYIMCAQYKRRIVQVWSIADPEWRCKLDEGLAGLSHACWSPDGCNILTNTEFQLRLTVWSLVDKSVSYIQFPKYSDKGLAFSHSGKFMVLAERKDFKDYLGIYHTDQWKLVKHFQTETEDLCDVTWSPDDRWLAVWDTSLEYRLVVYTPDGTKITRYTAYEHALGIKDVVWSPSGSFLAVGSFDEACRLFNNVTWKVLGEYAHTSPVAQREGAVIYRERLVDGRGELIPTERVTEKDDGPSKYVVADMPFHVPQVTPTPEQADPKMGVGKMKFSHDDLYLATVNANMPGTVWIWDLQTLVLASVLCHTKPVRSFEWDPCRHRMSVSTGNNKLYLWSPEGCSIVDIPQDSFTLRKVEWNQDGNSLLLQDKSALCCCYIEPSSA